MIGGRNDGSTLVLELPQKDVFTTGVHCDGIIVLQELALLSLLLFRSTFW
jgi:hypothetical protein